MMACRLSVESLPYTLLLLLAQFTAGCAAAVLYCQARGGFEAALIKTCTWLTVSGAALTTLTAFAIEPAANVAGYRLDTSALDPIRAASLALLLFSCIHFVFVRREDEAFLATATGATTAGVGFVLLLFCASLVRFPVWNVAGPLLTLFAGALVLGVLTVAMIWGHWYLVKPSLEAGPLNELILISLGALVLQLAITLLNAAIPIGEPFESDALLAIELVRNPGLWLRIGIGLVFPILLVFMAYQSSKEHSMMSATGLLYIAVGAILAGEAVGRGLLFVTGAAV